VQTSTSAGTDRIGPPDSAKVAYLILTHKDPDQVMALADRIHHLSPTSHVVVHHDRKADTLPWGDTPPQWVHLVDRVQVEWGDWSIVEATLRMFRLAHQQLKASWFVVVSGEHWPVVNLEAWEKAIAASDVDAYLPAVLLPPRLRFGPSDRDGNRFLARCIHRWFRINRPSSELVHKVLAGLSKISLWTHPVAKLEFSLRSNAWFLGIPRGRGPVRGWDLYKGSEWLACNARSVEVLLATDAEVKDWFRRSHIPDESYVQTILRRGSDLTVDTADVTWVPPEPEIAEAGWMLLKANQLTQVENSGVAFARKVDPLRNPEVIQAIDRRVDAASLPRNAIDRPHPTGPIDASTRPS
jgi:hypothetical protein